MGERVHQSKVPLVSFGIREPVSALTHFVAALAAAYAMRKLWRLPDGPPGRQASLRCFGITLVLSFTASSVYHGVIVSPKHQSLLRLLDHSAIYLLIAGTYTPTIVVLLPPSVHKSYLLPSIWLLALAGISCKWLIAAPPQWLVVGPYIALGWVGVPFFPQLLRAVGRRGMTWLAAGGISYTAGAMIDALERPSLSRIGLGPHEIFHLFTMGAAYLHVVFMSRHVAPYRLAASGFASSSESQRVEDPTVVFRGHTSPLVSLPDGDLA